MMNKCILGVEKYFCVRFDAIQFYRISLQIEAKTQAQWYCFEAF